MQQQQQQQLPQQQFATHVVEKVTAFHVKYGFSVDSPDPKTYILRYHIVLEELSELLLAVYEENELDLVDALGDLLYVCAGTVVSLGSRSSSSAPSPVPSDSVSPWSPQGNAILRWSVNMLLKGLSQCDYDLMVSQAIDLLWSFNYDAKGIFDEIHDSNMTKDVSERGPAAAHPVKGPNYRAPNLERFCKNWES